MILESKRKRKKEGEERGREKERWMGRERGMGRRRERFVVPVVHAFIGCFLYVP